MGHLFPLLLPQQAGPKASTEAHRAPQPPAPAAFPSRAFPWAALKEMWLTYTQFLATHQTGQGTHSLHAPLPPGMLATPVRQVCLVVILSGAPWLTAPLPLNLSPNPPKEASRQMGPQGYLSQKCMKPETTSRPSLLSFRREQQLATHQAAATLHTGKVLPVRSPAQAGAPGWPGTSCFTPAREEAI